MFGFISPSVPTRCSLSHGRQCALAKLNTRVRTFPLWQNLALFAHAFPARRDSRAGKDSDVTVWSGVVGKKERFLVRGESDRASRDEGVRDFNSLMVGHVRVCHIRQE